MTIQDLFNEGIKLYAIRVVENKNNEIESEHYYESSSFIPKEYRNLRISYMYANKTEYLTIEVEHDND